MPSIKNSFIKNRNGLKLAISFGGNQHDQTVLFLHGGGQTRNSWENTMQELINQGYAVYSYDARGHGESEWSDLNQYDLNDLSDDLVDVINALNDKPIIIGASMGGLTSLHAINKLGNDLARALILVDIVPSLAPVGTQKIVDFLQGHVDGFESLEQAADIVSAFNPLRKRPKNLSGLLKNLRRGENNRFYWHWDPDFFHTTNLSQPLKLTNHLNQTSSLIKFPVLLVRGMSSEVVTDKNVEDFKKYIPHLEVFEVHKASHMITGDQNDIFNQGILSFINTYLDK